MIYPMIDTFTANLIVGYEEYAFIYDNVVTKGNEFSFEILTKRWIMEEITKKHDLYTLTWHGTDYMSTVPLRYGFYVAIITPLKNTDSRMIQQIILDEIREKSDVKIYSFTEAEEVLNENIKAHRKNRPWWEKLWEHISRMIRRITR